MSRRTVVKKRPVPPDPVYNSRLISMTVRRIMHSGKKNTAASILYDALKTVEERTGAEPLETFEKAVRNITPLVEVKARRVGGATYQVPMEVRPDRGTALALRWLIQFSRQRPGKTMAGKLANEIMDAATKLVMPFVNGKKLIEWQKLTKLLLIIVTKLCAPKHRITSKENFSQ